MRENCQHRDDLIAVTRNPAAPADVLLRLLHPEAKAAWNYLAWRALPNEVVDAILAHPEKRLRTALAENIMIAPEQRARLIDDTSRGVRLALAMGPDWFRRPSPPLPEWAQRRLLDDTDPLVRHETAWNHLTDARLIAGLADHEDPVMRAAACIQWDLLTADTRDRLRDDPDEHVRLTAREGGTPVPALTRAAAERIAHTGEPAERLSVASDPAVPKDVALLLADDESHDIRLAVASRQDLTEDERAAIDCEVRPEDRLHPVQWVLDTVDSETLRSCATSANTLLRRSTAYNKHLPPDVIETLSRDSDYAVRLLLCENQPTADSETVLQTYLDCYVITKSDLLRHPNFPRTGNAARFATDPDPARRRLALLDPDIPTEVLLNLLRDADRGVRAWAAQHERLPAEQIAECCVDPATRSAALSNRSLPVEIMHRVLDEMGVPRGTML